MAKPSLSELEQDVEYLAKRTMRVGGNDRNRDRAYRDWGLSSNSIVGIAYGLDVPQTMPWDRADYAACVRAVKRMPRHRRTAQVLLALRQAKRSYKQGWGR